MHKHAACSTCNWVRGHLSISLHTSTHSLGHFELLPVIVVIQCLSICLSHLCTESQWHCKLLGHVSTQIALQSYYLKHVDLSPTKPLKVIISYVWTKLSTSHCTASTVHRHLRSVKTHSVHQQVNISWKWCKTEPQFQWKTNGKQYVIWWKAPWMTLKVILAV